MKSPEEKILLSIIDHISLKSDKLKGQSVADYTPMLESIIEGIVKGAAEDEAEQAVGMRQRMLRQRMYKHAREFLLDMYMQNRHEENDFDIAQDENLIYSN